MLPLDSGYYGLVAHHTPRAITKGVRIEAIEAVRDGREELLTDHEYQNVEFIRAVRRMWNEGGCYPIGRTRPLYSECHRSGGAFDRVRRAALAEVGHLAAAPVLLPFLKQLESARAAFLEVAMRHAEGESNDLMTVTAKLNEAWMAVEADVLPIVETQVALSYACMF